MSLSLVLNWLFQTFVAGAATVAFAVIFHTPRKEYIFAGITGGLGWLVYLAALHFTGGVVAASFFATVALTWISRIFSFLRRTPVTVYLICGIFPIVPGAGIYYTGYHLFMSDNALALDKGLETIKIAIAIALGIGIVMSLPGVLFSFRRKEAGSRAQAGSNSTEK